jgi:soluble lytic murein transglycosylase-like protein
MQRRKILAHTLAVAATGFATRATAAVRPAPLPPGYQAMGRRAGVPPLVLYGVALQESKLLFGPHALPYPWTLCVAGEPRRFASHAAAVADLRRCVTGGVRNVDCGSMQVNWHWHADKLGSFERALDPYPNLAVGAFILRSLYAGDWFAAVGQYHTGPTRTPEQALRGERYAAAVFARIATIPRTDGRARRAHA